MDRSARGRRDQAIEALLSIDPAQVTDSEVRKQIARNFRSLALEERRDRQGKAVRGLIQYAGRYSIPVLCELVDRGDPDVHDEVFTALAAARDPRAAESVAGRLGDRRLRDRAKECLRKMGPEAEPALIAAAGSDDQEVSLAAIELLAEVGSRECLDTLRRAIRGQNEQLSAARSVRVRLREQGA